MKPPFGYRLLKSGEITKNGDMYYDWSGTWKSLKDKDINRTYSSAWSPVVTKAIDKVNYTDNDKNVILKYLKKQKAFNEDSALRPELKVNLFYTLSEDKIIGRIDDRFFYNNYE